MAPSGSSRCVHLPDVSCSSIPRQSMPEQLYLSWFNRNRGGYIGAVAQHTAISEPWRSKIAFNASAHQSYLSYRFFRIVKSLTNSLTQST
jgi:hypothetical protein